MSFSVFYSASNALPLIASVHQLIWNSHIDANRVCKNSTNDTGAHLQTSVTRSEYAPLLANGDEFRKSKTRCSVLERSCKTAARKRFETNCKAIEIASGVVRSSPNCCEMNHRNKSGGTASNGLGHSEEELEADEAENCIFFFFFFACFAVSSA